MSTPRILTALFLTFGVVLAVSSRFYTSIVGLLSGQGSTLVPEKSLSIPLLILPEPFLHAAAPEQAAATRELMIGILLILLGLGIYTFWSIRNRNLSHHPRQHQKLTTVTRVSSRWFWIG